MDKYPISITGIVKLLSYASKVEIRAAGGTSKSLEEWVVEEVIATAHSFALFACLLGRKVDGSPCCLKFYREHNSGTAFVEDSHDLALQSQLGPVFLRLTGPMNLKMQLELWKTQDT